MDMDCMTGTKWYKCPYCGKNLFVLDSKTVIKNLSYRCKACKHDIDVNVGDINEDDSKCTGNRMDHQDREQS